VKRLEGWEQRLFETIDAARARPYVVGKADCFRLACEVVTALTGEPSRWPEFEGKYHDEEGANKLVQQHGGFLVGFSSFSGIERVGIKNARRGDVCGYADEKRKLHLGICIGANVALLGPSGLVFVPLESCFCTWRIG